MGGRSSTAQRHDGSGPSGPTRSGAAASLTMARRAETGGNVNDQQKLAAWEAGYEMGARTNHANFDADSALIEATERRMVPDLSEDDGEAFDVLCAELGAGFRAGLASRAG